MVDDVDHGTHGGVRQLTGEILREHEWRAQIGFKMSVPALPRSRRHRIGFEQRRIVDKDTKRAKRIGCPVDKRDGLVLARKVRPKRDRPTAGGFDFGDGRLRLGF